MEVRYSINGNYFKDFGVFVSASKGIADTLKRKKINSYDWAEYHGVSVDLEKPKYEAREIELQCFIVGDNWETLFQNFSKMIRDEFSKSGTQRLLIEPFGYKPLPYEVYMQDEIAVDKQFRVGKMVAVFSLKLIEPNPVKKVLLLTGSILDLSFSSNSETEIFFDGGKATYQGNVAIAGKAIPNRELTSYPFSNRNLLTLDSGISNQFGTGYLVASFPILKPLENGKQYTVIAKTANSSTQELLMYINGNQFIGTCAMVGGGITRTTFTPNGSAPNTAINFYNNTQTALAGVFWVMLVEGDGSGINEWNAAPEYQHYIIIAGNIDEITNLQTNAQELWTKL